MKISVIDKVLLYSYQSKDKEILYNLDFNIKIKEIKNGMINVMRNNFSRFWNIMTKEQRIKYIKLSLEKEESNETIEKEELYEIIEKIIRFSCEISIAELYDEFILQNLESLNANNYFNFRHDIVKFWLSMNKHEKIKFLDVVNNYWKKNKYFEYKSWNIDNIKEDEKLCLIDKELKSIDLIITENIKYLDCRNNNIEKLDDLPIGLEVLLCDNNPIKNLNNLPRRLKYLCCVDCDIVEILNLPQDLRFLDISFNYLKTIELPQYIEKLYINTTYADNNLEILEDIPNMIIDLEIINDKMRITNRFPYGIEKFSRNEYVSNKFGITDYIGLPTSIKKLERFECYF